MLRLKSKIKSHLARPILAFVMVFGLATLVAPPITSLLTPQEAHASTVSVNSWWAIQDAIWSAGTVATTIHIPQNLTVNYDPITVPFGANITITTTPGNPTITLLQLSTERHFIVEGTLTLVNITLSGAGLAPQEFTLTSNGGVEVDGGTLIMNSNSTIRDNIYSAGGGVEVWNAGSLIMNPGSLITNNRASIAGGVYVRAKFESTGFQNPPIISPSYLIMNGGEISHNATPHWNIPLNQGGGVFLSYSNLIINDGSISHNTSGGNGGGVFAHNSSTLMQGGTITHNTSLLGKGGGIGIPEESAYIPSFLTIDGGTIAHNSAVDGGGIAIIFIPRQPPGPGGTFLTPYFDLVTKITDKTIFHSNSADTALNYDLAQGLIDFPDIRWHGYTTGNNSIIGTHLFNNYDLFISGLSGPVAYHQVTFFYLSNLTYMTRNVLSGSPAEPPHTLPVRPDYIFTGWHTLGGSLWNFNTAITSDLNLYAHWQPIPGVPDTGFARTASTPSASPTLLAVAIGFGTMILIAGAVKATSRP